MLENWMNFVWSPQVALFDASDYGGGVCQTTRTKKEIKAEAKWAVRGGWVKYLDDPDFSQHYRPGEEAAEELVIKLPPGKRK